MFDPQNIQESEIINSIAEAETQPNSIAASNGQAADNSPSQKSSPSKLDNYTVHHHIGEGAFGEVSLAVEKESKRNVAIKSVSIRKILELNKERHILREKELLMDLKHPNIIQLYTTFKVSHFSNFLSSFFNLNRTIKTYILSSKLVRMAPLMTKSRVQEASLPKRSSEYNLPN